MSYHSPQKRIPTLVWAVGLVVGVLFIGLAVMSSKAKAADNNGPANILKDVAPKPGNWSGCGPGIRAGWGIVAADFSPVTMSAEGAKVGAEALCDWQAGKHFLIGVFARYDQATGDLDTLGIQSDISLGGRVGVPLNKNVMLYGGAAWSRVNIDGAGHVDGYKAIGGLEVRLGTDAPLFFSVEGERGFYSNVLGSGIDANTTQITASLKYKFGAK